VVLYLVDISLSVAVQLGLFCEVSMFCLCLNGLLPQSENMCFRLTGNFKLPINVSRHDLSVSPEMDGQAA